MAIQLHQLKHLRGLNCVSGGEYGQIDYGGVAASEMQRFVKDNIGQEISCFHHSICHMHEVLVFRYGLSTKNNEK